MARDAPPSRSAGVPPAPPRTGAPAPSEAARAARRQVLHFSLLLLASWLTASLPLPWEASGLAFAVAAVVVGIRALRTAVRAGLRDRLAPVLAFGLTFAVLLVLSMAATLVFWPVQMERQECLSGALTISAREACETQFQQSLSEHLMRLTGQSAG